MVFIFSFVWYILLQYIVWMEDITLFINQFLYGVSFFKYISTVQNIGYKIFCYQKGSDYTVVYRQNML